jgi:all-trans-retinol 13,14-reductase
LTNYDFLILGSGLGGLVCGAILSKHGFKVCILEKNKQLGGNLQTFVRNKTIFDSGVHYVGGLDVGQNLYQIFKYLDIIDKLKLEKLNNNAFDKIIFRGDKNEYPHAQGYENFIQQLAQFLPEEERAIRNYCDAIRLTCSKFPMYNLQSGKTFNDKSSQLEINAKEKIASFTNNKKLQDILAGNNFLYAGDPNKTPFYVHALIVNSYILSAWKFVDGGSQIGKYLAAVIRNNGGEIKRNQEVIKIIEEDGIVSHILTHNGEKLSASNFISNIHPDLTFSMLDSKCIRKAYRKKWQDAENSVGAFSINIVLKPNKFPYKNQNYYVHIEEDGIWNSTDYDTKSWPKSYCLFVSPCSKNKQYAEAVSVLTYMRFADVAAWENTTNTVTKEEWRGEAYEQFKKEKAAKLLSEVYKEFPELKEAIQYIYTSTPLTYRDYIGTKDGSMYGIVKDIKDPLMSFMPSRTKIPNLFLTGQNIAMHGILGVTITALSTCANFIDIEKLLQEINDA